MFRFKVSKFKNAAPKVPKREYCFTDVPVGTIMNSCGNHITASCKFIAFNCELGGGHGIGILGLEDYGRQQRTMPIIHGHADFVSDMCFSPFDDCLLATGAFDGEVKIWKIPDDGLEEILNNPFIHLPSSSRRIDNILFHPAAKNVLSLTSNHAVQIYDLEASRLHYEIQNEADELPFQSMAWKSDGSLLVTSCKDTKLRIIDPRSSSVSAVGSGHPGAKDSRTVWIGNTDRILSTGFGKTRDRTIGIWDIRNFDSAMVTESVDNDAGILMPFYDVDTNMLLLTGKGDSKVYFYEINGDATSVTLASSDHLETQTTGMSNVPKRALHLMEAEVNRLLQLTKNCIIPISYIVPRRSYNDFHAELYPDTSSGVASMTAEQWLNGANESVSLIKLDPKSGMQKSLPKALESKQQAPPSQTMAAVHHEPKPVKTVEEHKAPAAKFHGFRVTKFKYLTGKPSHKAQNIENIKNFDETLSHESNGLQAYKDLVAYPIAGPGGQIAVVKLSEPKRLPDAGMPVLQNPSPLLDFSMDPFDNHLIAAGCEDSVVRIWRVPKEGLVETMVEPVAILAGHYSKVNIVRYHPCVSNLLTTASYDLNVILWDVESGSELITLQQHPEYISALSWHPDGHLLATVAKDTMIRVFDPRKSTDPIQVGAGPGSPRGARISWCGPNNDWLIVSGINQQGFRCLNLYDSKDLSKSIAEKELSASPATLMLFYDEDSGTVFATGKGDRNLQAFEVSADPPHLFPLSSYKGALEHQGFAILRKDLCNVREVEFLKAVRVSYTTMEQVSLTVPRVKKDYFQDDLFPETRVNWEPSMTCEEWMGGANVPQKRLDLRPTDMQPLHAAPQSESSKADKFANNGNAKEAKSVKQQTDDLMSQMEGKFEQLGDKPLEQDTMEGVEDHEWDD